MLPLLQTLLRVYKCARVVTDSLPAIVQSVTETYLLIAADHVEIGNADSCTHLHVHMLQLPNVAVTLRLRIQDIYLFSQ